MKKLFFSILLAAVSIAARAQDPAAAAGDKSEWLPSFARIEVSGSVDVVLECVPDSVAPKIVYDTKGSYTTRFRAEVKDRVLYVRERTDARRPERTQARICYNELTSLAVTDAAVTLADTLQRKIFYVSVAGNASLKGVLQVDDLELNATGESTTELSGLARYVTLYASTAKAALTNLESMSVRVNAQSNASVEVWSTDRLEVKLSTGASLRYRGEPAIIRTSMKFLAGEIRPLK